jgi:hypothetical protein
VEVEEELVVG